MIRSIVTTALALCLLMGASNASANQREGVAIVRAPQLSWVDVDVNQTRDHLASVRMDLAMAHDLDSLRADAQWLTLNHPRSAAGVQVTEALRTELNSWTAPTNPELATQLSQLNGALAHQHAIYARLNVLPARPLSLAATRGRLVQLRENPSPLAPPALIAHNQHLQLSLGWPFTQAILVYGHELEAIALQAADSGDQAMANQAIALADLVLQYSTLPV